jgi:hypothetical protein
MMRQKIKRGFSRLLWTISDIYKVSDCMSIVVSKMF